MWRHTELSQFEVPGKRLGGKVLCCNPVHQLLMVVNPLTACRKLPDPLGCYEVRRLRNLRPVRIGHVIEGPGGKRIICDEERRLLGQADGSLSLGREVLAPFEPEP